MAKRLCVDANIIHKAGVGYCPHGGEAMRVPDLARDEQAGEVIQKVTLQPREDKEVFIGVFEEGLREPQFEVEISPRNSEKVKYELLRFDEGDEYKLIYYFQNLTYHTCQVTIREKSYVGGMYVS